jgi:NADH-quinone oxidoreductase subunit G
VLNARIRERWRHMQGHLPIGLIGAASDLTYAYDHLGAGSETLATLASGSHPFLEKAKGAELPLVIVGQAALARPDGEAVLALAAKAALALGAVTPDGGWNGFSVLHNAAARVAGLELGLVPGKGGKDVAAILAGAEQGEIEAVYLLGADEIEMARLGKAFVIYQGSHGDRGAHRADVILPGAAYSEKDALYVNTEGRPQMTARAVFPPGEAREDWTIIRALSAVLGQPLPFNSAAELRAALFAVAPHLALLDHILPADSAAIAKLAAKGGKTGKERFGRTIADFYLTNPIARASAIMASLSALHAAHPGEATGTDG